MKGLGVDPWPKTTRVEAWRAGGAETEGAGERLRGRLEAGDWEGWDESESEWMVKELG